MAKHPRAMLPMGPTPPPAPRQPRAPKAAPRPPKPGGGSLAARARRDPALLRRALRNPGLRSKLPSSMLTRQQRGQRGANARQAAAKVKAQAKARQQKAPIVPGSGITEGQLGRDTRAAMDTKYGALETQQRRQTGEAQTWERDTGGYYDQYLKQVAQQAANVRQIGTDANQQVAGLQAGVTGLATQDLRDIQAPANEDAKARGMVAGDNTQLASGAAATRQGLLGSAAAEQVAQNAASSRYANAMAHVVAPGQKLQGVAQAHGRVRQARDTQAATARERGASALSYKADRRSEESRNLLAQATLTGNLASKAATAAAGRATRRETRRHNRAGETAAQARIRVAKDKADAAARLAAGKVNQYGYTDKDWRAMSVAERRAIIAQNAGGKKGNGKGKDKSNLLTPGQAGKGLSELDSLHAYVLKAYRGEPFVKGHSRQTPLLNRHAADKKIRESVAAPSNPILKTAVYDAVYDGHLSPTTIRGLHLAGYRIEDVVRILHTTTRLGGRHFHGTHGG